MSLKNKQNFNYGLDKIFPEAEDFLPLLGTDYVELYVGNAKQAAHYYKTAFGFQSLAYAGLETGLKDRTSYVLVQDKIRLVLTTPMPSSKNKEVFENCFEIFKRDINFGRLSPFEALRIMPTRVYLNLNNDLGYTNDPYFNEGNSLNNSLLWGRGAGLDIIVYYFLVVQMEYSINQQGGLIKQER